MVGEREQSPQQESSHSKSRNPCSILSSTRSLTLAYISSSYGYYIINFITNVPNTISNTGRLQTISGHTSQRGQITCFRLRKRTWLTESVRLSAKLEDDFFSVAAIQRHGTLRVSKPHTTQSQRQSERRLARYPCDEVGLALATSQ